MNYLGILYLKNYFMKYIIDLFNLIQTPGIFKYFSQYLLVCKMKVIALWQKMKTHPS